MEQETKWHAFWKQIAGNLDFVGAWIIGLLVSITGFIGDLITAIMSGPVNWVSFGIKGAGILSFIIGTVIYLRRIYHTAVLIVSPKHLPVLFAINVAQDKVDEMYQSVKDAVTKKTGFKDFKEFEKYFGVNYSNDLVIHRHERIRPDASEWKDLVYEAQCQIGRFTCKIPGDKIYHIFFNGPASLAMGFGAIMGVKHKVVVYQYTGSEYKPVLDLSGANTRAIKETISGDLQYFNFPAPKNISSDTALLLGLASHVVEEDAKKHITENNIAGSIVIVRNNYAGNLKETDWTKPVQELFNVFTRLKAAGQVNHIHLFHGMPVALAIGLGMALSTFVHVTVYNWESKESMYYPVLELNKLKTIL